MTDWEYKKEFYNDAWIPALRNPSTLCNLQCLIRWFLNIKSEQGWEVTESFPHVLSDEAGAQRGIVVIFKRPKTTVMVHSDPL